MLRALERQKHSPADLERVLEALQGRRIAPPVFVAEVRIADARREDQEVVAERSGVLDSNGPAGEVDRRDLAEKHLCVFLPAKDRANGIGNVTRRQARHRDLIEKWLKEMVVAAIDDRHSHRRTAQPLGCVETAEAAADDDDVGLRPLWHIDPG